MSPIQLKVYIWMFFNNLIREENVTFSDISWSFSDNVQGTLNISDILVTGVDTIINQVENMDATEDDDGNNNLCVLFPAEYLELTLNYDADIGIDNEIPIYGDGNVLYRFNNIAFNACMFINHNENYIDEVEVNFIYRHTPLELTGFWRNSEVSIILTRLLNFVNRFIAMWNYYEPERTSCIWSPFVSYGLNIWLENENATLDFDPLCIKEIMFDEEDSSETEIEEQVLRNILKGHVNDDNDDKLNELANDDKSFILPVIKHLTQVGMGLF